MFEITYCCDGKVGDFLITVGPEKIAAGAKIVIEAKESAAYDLTKTLAEADMAKRNRAAGVCVFVHSEKTAPASIPSFARYGHDIVVRWDVDNEASDVWLKAAMMLATALSVRAIQHDKNEAASFQIVDRAIEGIRKQMEGFDDISTYATTSGKTAASILKRTEIMKEQMISKVEALCLQIKKLKLSSAAGE